MGQLKCGLTAAVSTFIRLLFAVLCLMTCGLFGMIGVSLLGRVVYSDILPALSSTEEPPNHLDRIGYVFAGVFAAILIVETVIYCVSALTSVVAQVAFVAWWRAWYPTLLLVGNEEETSSSKGPTSMSSGDAGDDAPDGEPESMRQLEAALKSQRIFDGLDAARVFSLTADRAEQVVAWLMGACVLTAIIAAAVWPQADAASSSISSSGGDGYYTPSAIADGVKRLAPTSSIAALSGFTQYGTSVISNVIMVTNLGVLAATIGILLLRSVLALLRGAHGWCGNKRLKDLKAGPVRRAATIAVLLIASPLLLGFLPFLLLCLRTLSRAEQGIIACYSSLAHCYAVLPCRRQPVASPTHRQKTAQTGCLTAIYRYASAWYMTLPLFDFKDHSRRPGGSVDKAAGSTADRAQDPPAGCCGRPSKVDVGWQGLGLLGFGVGHGAWANFILNLRQFNAWYVLVWFGGAVVYYRSYAALLAGLGVIAMAGALTCMGGMCYRLRRSRLCGGGGIRRGESTSSSRKQRAEHIPPLVVLIHNTAATSAIETAVAGASTGGEASTSDTGSHRGRATVASYRHVSQVAAFAARPRSPQRPPTFHGATLFGVAKTGLKLKQKSRQQSNSPPASQDDDVTVVQDEPKEGEEEAAHASPRSASTSAPEVTDRTHSSAHPHPFLSATPTSSSASASSSVVNSQNMRTNTIGSVASQLPPTSGSPRVSVATVTASEVFSPLDGRDIETALALQMSGPNTGADKVNFHYVTAGCSLPGQCASPCSPGSASPARKTAPSSAAAAAVAAKTGGAAAVVSDHEAAVPPRNLSLSDLAHDSDVMMLVGASEAEVTPACAWGGMLLALCMLACLCGFAASPQLGAAMAIMTAFLTGSWCVRRPKHGSCSSLCRLTLTLVGAVFGFFQSSFSDDSGRIPLYVPALGAANAWDNVTSSAAAAGLTSSSALLPSHSYPVCDDLPNGASVLDHCFLAMTAYSPDAMRDNDVTAWFTAANRSLTPLPFPNTTSGVEAAVFLEEEEVVTSGGGALHLQQRLYFVVRGTKTKKDIAQDALMWLETMMLQLLEVVGPYSSWPTVVKQGFIATSSRLAGSLDTKDQLQYSRELTDAVRAVIAAYPNASVSITGHSLGGGLATLVSQLLGARSVSFSGPGVLLTAQKLGLPSRLDASLPLTIVPDYDIVPKIDQHVGATQAIRCLGGSSPLECHSIKRTCCELRRACGDPAGRRIAVCPAFSGV